MNKLLLLILLTIGPFGVFFLGFIHILPEAYNAAEIFSLDRIFINEWLFSLYIASSSSLISIIIGSYITFELIEKNIQSNNFIFKLIILIPHLAFTFIIYQFFSSEGFLSRLLGVPIELINDQMGIGIILNYVLKEIPFITLFLLSTKTDRIIASIKVAKDLGANKFESFLKVYLPQNTPSIISIFIIIFTFTLGNYEIPKALGNTSLYMSAVTAMENFQSIDEDDNLKSYILVLIIFSTSLLVSVLARRSKR